MHSIRFYQQFPRFAVLSLGLLLSPCSSQQVYTAIQENQKIRCQNEKLQSAYQECMSRYQERYDEYQRKRLGD